MDPSAPPRMSPDLVELGSRSPVAVRRTRLGPWLLVVVEGEMDLRVVPVLADVRVGDPSRVVFDLSAVSFMDCSGVAALMYARKLARLRGGCVRVAAPSAPVRRVLALTATDRFFEEFDTVEAAVFAPAILGDSGVSTGVRE